MVVGDDVSVIGNDHTAAATLSGLEHIAEPKEIPEHGIAEKGIVAIILLFLLSHALLAFLSVDLHHHLERLVGGQGKIRTCCHRTTQGRFVYLKNRCLIVGGSQPDFMTSKIKGCENHCTTCNPGQIVRPNVSHDLH